MSAERLGIVDAAQELARRFAERHPALRRRIMGQAPVFLNPVEHQISVDCRTGERTVHDKIDMLNHQRAIEARTAQLVREAIEKEAQARAAQQLVTLAREAGQLRPTLVPIRDIFAAVIEATDYSYAELVGPRRSRHVSRARHIVFWLIRELRGDLSFPAIGRVVGNRDHTTIMAGVLRFQSVRDQEPTKSWLEHPSIAALIARI